MHALDLRTAQLLRELTPRVLGVVARRYRDFAGCEDAVQEALVAAAAQWPTQGVPDNPRAWLIHVASRRITDEMRAEASRRHREKYVVSLIPIDEQIALAADEVEIDRDDTLDLLFMCCHPSLSPSSQIALTLRAVGGLTTTEIARAFMVPEATMAQRLSRAKQSIKESGVQFGAARTDAERSGALSSVLHVLYLIFSEGYSASGGDLVLRVDLSSEAIRVVRLLRDAAPEAHEVNGLLALMLLTDARRDARTGRHGELIPLDAQDRTRWDRAAIEEGTNLISATLSQGHIGPYQVQAAIAALHDEAASTDATDWVQIHALYGVLVGLTDSPMARLSQVVALAMIEGPDAGLVMLERLAHDVRLAGRVDAVRAHLLERAGDRQAAIAHYRRAAERTSSTAERNYLLLAAARLVDG